MNTIHSSLLKFRIITLLIALEYESNNLSEIPSDLMISVMNFLGLKDSKLNNSLNSS